MPLIPAMSSDGVGNYFSESLYMAENYNKVEQML